VNTPSGRKDSDPAPLAPQEQDGPWKGMRPPSQEPSAVPLDRASGEPAPSAAPPSRDLRAGLPNVAAFLAGVWLLVSPFLLEHPDTVAGFNAVWNDVVLGIAVALLAAVRVVAPFTSRGAGWVLVVLGVWLVLAPFVLGLTSAPPVVVNDIVVGAIVLVFTLAGMATATPRTKTRDDA
jgi:hypothetical protein